MMMLLRMIVMLVVLASQSRSARILGVFPLPSKSHQIVYDPIMVELAKRGHEVVMITVYPLADPPANLTQIDISFSSTEFKRRLRHADFQDKTPIQFIGEFTRVYNTIFEKQMRVPEVQKLLKDKNEHFDLIYLAGVPHVYGFKHRFSNAPVITLVSVSYEHSTVGAPTHPILYPEFLSVKIYDLNIFDKIRRILDWAQLQYMEWSHASFNNRVARKYFGDDMPDLLSIKRNMDMLFINANPAIVGVRPETPAVVHIDGIHMKPRKPLPKDLQEYLDNSYQGVVYMSLGSNVQSKDLSNATLNMLSEAFAELHYNILWKFEDDHLPGKPANVLIRKWLPQQDLLGHKNIKAFIFQGGMQSFDEAIRDKVPLICMPFAVDQKQNAERVERKKIGLRFDLNKGTKETLKAVIMNVTTDPIYKQNMIKLSKLSMDKQISSLDNAIWWSEYVLRHNGAKHLRAPAVDSSYVEYFMLDVFAVIFIFLFVTWIILSYLIKRVWIHIRKTLIVKRKTA